MKRLLGQKAPAKKVQKETWQDKLKNIVPEYKKNNTQFNSLKKIVDAQKGDIKAIMIENGIEQFEVGDIKITHSPSTKYDFVQDKLVAKLKKLGHNDLIKTVEVVDMDCLEKVLYEDESLAKELVDCQTSTTSYTLRLGKVKTDG